MKVSRFIGEFGQWLGALGGVGGTYAQIHDKSETTVIVVMLASLAYAGFTKYKYYRRKADERKAISNRPLGIVGDTVHRHGPNTDG